MKNEHEEFQKFRGENKSFLSFVNEAAPLLSSVFSVPKINGALFEKHDWRKADSQRGRRMALLKQKTSSFHSKSFQWRFVGQSQTTIHLKGKVHTRASLAAIVIKKANYSA